MSTVRLEYGPVKPDFAEEIALVRRYRAETRAIEKQAQRLNSIKMGMFYALKGLEEILKANGVNPDEILDGNDEGSAPTAPATSEPVKKFNVLTAAIAAISRLGKSVGAKDLQRLMGDGGIKVNYYTLHKNLAREAARDNGLIVRDDDKYGLREWATNDPGRTGDRDGDEEETAI